MVAGWSLDGVTQASDIAPVSSKDFLDIQATTEYGFTLNRVRDMIRTYNQNITPRFYRNSKINSAFHALTPNFVKMK